MKHLVLFVALAALMSGCSKSTPTQPSSMSPVQAGAALRSWPGATPAGGPPGYEPAYVNGQTVTINAIEVPNHAPAIAQADFYELVYPIGWQQMGLAPPQCNPCDHDGNGIDPQDFHDHILDSMPGTPGHNYTALWHVYAIVPAYNGNSSHDAATGLAYASHIPIKSEDGINDLLAVRDGNGAPIAVKIDTQFYFLCAVVNGMAAK